MTQLRPYQQDNIADIREALRTSRRRAVLWQLATGGGKTLGAAYMIKGALAKGKRAWFIVHRRELVRQSALALRAEGVEPSFIAADEFYDPRSRIHICSIDTLRRRLKRVRKPDLVVWDEVHHLGARTWAETYAELHGSAHIGLSATPARTDGRGLGDFFDAMVCGPSVADLISMGYLAPYKLYAPQLADREGLHSRYGEFIRSETEAMMDKPTITGDAVAHYQRITPGKRGLAFCVSVEASKHCAEQFRANGINAWSIDGSLATDVRDQLIGDYMRGKIQVLTNCNLVTEGFNVEGAEVLIDLDPTQSLIRHLQKNGRVLRPLPNKIAYLLDHVGNWTAHGLPDDDREWTLEGRKSDRAANTENGLRNRQCPKCFAVFRFGLSECPECGHVMEGKPRQVAEKDGELHEVDTAAARRVRSDAEQSRMAEQAKARSLDALVELGRMRGYSQPERWAEHLWAARTGKRRRAA